MARPRTPVAEYKKLMLRLPDTMLATCQDLAAAHHHSLNAEILQALDAWFAQHKVTRQPGRRPPRAS
jgi:hypothetical protein